MRRLLVLAATLAVVASATASAALKSPCALVTAADAKSALGVSFGSGKAEKLGLYQACVYTSAKNGLSILARQTTRSSFDRSAKANPGKIVHVSGIGADAYRAGPAFLLWKDGTEVSLLASGFANPLKAEETLGRAAAGRL